jgi:hypothetical protein
MLLASVCLVVLTIFAIIGAMTLLIELEKLGII